MTDAQGPDIPGLVLDRVIGSGGYSDVYLYQQSAPRRAVAVKVLKSAQLAESELADFAAEAETMAGLADHPYIVQVFATGATEEGRPYLVMQYYPGKNLAGRAASRPYSVPDALRVGIKVACAVETAHRAGILHRDIKPANILLSPYGEPGLTDFGIAGHLATAADDEDLGVSVPWAPPEVLSGASNGSVAADVYSLAATVWHLLVGRSPFVVPDGENGQAALVRRILTTTAPPTGRPEVPASLEALLARSMSRKIALRPRSALEFARELQAIEQEQRLGRTHLVVAGLGSARDQAADPDRGPSPQATNLRGIDHFSDVHGRQQPSSWPSNGSAAPAQTPPAASVDDVESSRTRLKAAAPAASAAPAMPAAAATVSGPSVATESSVTRLKTSPSSPQLSTPPAQAGVPATSWPSNVSWPTAPSWPSNGTGPSSVSWPSNVSWPSGGRTDGAALPAGDVVPPARRRHLSRKWLWLMSVACLLLAGGGVAIVVAVQVGAGSSAAGQVLQQRCTQPDDGDTDADGDAPQITCLAGSDGTVQASFTHAADASPTGDFWYQTYQTRREGDTDPSPAHELPGSSVTLLSGECVRAQYRGSDGTESSWSPWWCAR